MLERVATDMYAARAVTLDTHYWTMQRQDAGYFVEDKTTVSPTIDFYERRGYKVFTVGHIFPISSSSSAAAGNKETAETTLVLFARIHADWIVCCLIGTCAEIPKPGTG